MGYSAFAAGTSDTQSNSDSQNRIAPQQHSKQVNDLLKRQQDLMDAQERRSKQADEIFEENRLLIERQKKHVDAEEKGTQREADNQKRFEKILDKWEAQQAQYQKYLDSLPTSQKEAH
jgi:hypothetical protein